MHKLEANWHVPSHVFAFTTTRLDGYSFSPFDANNLALHVDDDSSAVIKNRQQLISRFSLPNPPVWLRQTHSNRCLILEQKQELVADAIITSTPNQVLAIMTADCLPILLTNESGNKIAAIHAGWRGLATKIIENTLKAFNEKEVIAWIGPGICGNCYTVNEDLVITFTHNYPFAFSHFTRQKDKIYANLPQLAENILKHNQVRRIFQSQYCTLENKKLFYSYRRTPQTGRMASLIWFN